MDLEAGRNGQCIVCGPTSKTPEAPQPFQPSKFARRSSADKSQQNASLLQRTLGFIITWRCAFAYPLISLCITLPLFYPISLSYIAPTATTYAKNSASRLCTAMADYINSSPSFISPISTSPLSSFLATVGYEYCMAPNQGGLNLNTTVFCPQALSDSVSCKITLNGTAGTLSLYPNPNTMAAVGWLPKTIYYFLIVFPIALAVVIAVLAGIIGYMTCRVRISLEKIENEADQLKALMVRQYELIEVLGGNRADARPSDEMKHNRSKGKDQESLVSLMDSVEEAKHYLKASDVELLAEKDEIVLLDPNPWSSLDVYKGSWRGSAVAVKSIVLTNQLTLKAKSEFIALLELALSSAISHPHIVQLYTYSIKVIQDKAKIALADKRMKDWKVSLAANDNNSQSLPLEAHTSPVANPPSPSPADAVEVLLCFEFCDCGSLRDMLDNGTFLDGEGLNYPAILQTAIDIARGLAHIHASDMVLGDLTASSVWLKRDFNDARGVVAKVADFGQSVGLHSSSASSFVTDAFQGTLTHLAPEVILMGRLSKASDVYSFGILLYELFTSGRPFHSVPHTLLRHQITRDKKRPSFPLVVPSSYQALAEECWDHDPEQRPTIASIVDRLTSFKMDLSASMRPLKKITLLAAMIQKSGLETRQSTEGPGSFDAADSETPVNSKNPPRRSESPLLLKGLRGQPTLSAASEAQGSKSKGRFISGAVASNASGPNQPSPNITPKHSPPLPTPVDVEAMIMRASPAPLLLPLPPGSHPNSSNMGRSTSTPTPTQSMTLEEHSSEPSNVTLGSNSQDGSELLLTSKNSIPMQRSPLSSNQEITPARDMGGEDEKGDVLATLLSSLQREASATLTDYDLKLIPQAPSPERGFVEGSWEEGPGIVLVPGTILSAEGAYLPETPLSAPIPPPSNAAGPDVSSVAGSSKSAAWLPSTKRLGPVAKAVARMKNISVRKSTTCSMETIDEAAMEGEGPAFFTTSPLGLQSPYDSFPPPNPLDLVTAKSSFPPPNPLDLVTAKSSFPPPNPLNPKPNPLDLVTAKSSSGPHPRTFRNSSSTAAAVASVVGTLSVQGLMSTMAVKEEQMEEVMSNGQIQRLREQQAHRAVMEVDRENPVLVIGRETGEVSGSLFGDQALTTSSERREKEKEVSSLSRGGSN